MSTRKDYEKIANSLDFKEKFAIKKNFEKGYYIVRGEIKGRDVLLKIVPNIDKIRAALVEKERIVDEILEEHNKNISKPLIVKARVLMTGRNDKYSWIIRRYYPGLSLARMLPKRPMLGYDVIRPVFILKRSKIINLVVDNIKSLQSLTNDFRSLGIKKTDFDKYFEHNIEKLITEDLEKVLGIDLFLHREFYNTNKTKYLSREFKLAAATDLSPANIIIKDDGVLVFSDFELFSFDNYTMDAAYLWLFLYRYVNWQRRLTNLIIKNDQDRIFFRMSVIRILLSKYNFPGATVGKRDIESIKYFRKHKWARYLKVAGESFEALMKVK